MESAVASAPRRHGLPPLSKRSRDTIVFVTAAMIAPVPRPSIAGWSPRRAAVARRAQRRREARGRRRSPPRLRALLRRHSERLPFFAAVQVVQLLVGLHQQRLL